MRAMTVPSQAYSMPLTQLCAQLETDATRGLPPDVARQRLDEFGANQLPQGPALSPLRLLISQFTSLMVLILLAAAIVAVLAWYLAGHKGVPADALVIVTILLLNALLGFTQEYRAEQTMGKLRDVASASNVATRRGNALLHVPHGQLVPGDIIQLQAGDRVPADCILLSAVRLQADESTLTGESSPVFKRPGAVASDTAVDGQTCSLFAGTLLSAGEGTAVVVGTGNHTELGSLASLLAATTAEQTPLQRRLDTLGRQIGWGVLGIAALVAGTILLLEPVWNAAVLTRVLMFSVALAVAAVPEGLPAVLTVSLAVGTRRLARQQALIRKLSAVETLGSVTTIVSDKTGTLTHNQMTVASVFVDGVCHHVSGEGYALQGEIAGSPSAALQRLLLAGALANTAQMEPGQAVHGDAVDVSLLVLAHKGGLDWRSERKRCQELDAEPFSSERARASSLRLLDGQPVLWVKGSLESLLPLCSSYLPADHDAWQEQERSYASEGLRVLAVAEKIGCDAHQPAAAQEVGLNLLGLVALQDPPRSEAAAAIRQCHAAGIRVIMATGDHPQTAGAIARQVGLAKDGDQPTVGPDLERMSPAEWQRRTAECNVFGRMSPAAKLDLVGSLLSQGEVVAMTGDGVNDAPALHKVHVGIAMGSGSAVAVEASQVVLLDDNFATIVRAVRGGRVVYRNVQKFIAFLFAGNVGVVLAMFLGSLAAGVLHLSDNQGLLLPLTAAQILWMNLAVDGAPALAFALGRSEEDVMSEPPRSPDSPLLTRDLWIYLSLCGTCVAFVLLFTLDSLHRGGVFTWRAGGIDLARSAGFYAVVCARLANAFNFRHLSGSVFSAALVSEPWVPGACLFSWLLTLGVLYTPALQSIFNLVPLPWDVVLPLSLLAPLAVILPAEAYKRCFPLRLAEPNGRSR